MLNQILLEIPPPKDDDSLVLKRQREKCEEDEVVCRSCILNTLSDNLSDLFTMVKF